MSNHLDERKPINRFVVGSTVLHILSASAIVMLSQFPQPKPETIEIDFSTVPVAAEMSAPVQTPEIQEAAPAIQAPPQPEPVAEKSEPVMAEPAPKPQEKPAPVVAKVETKPVETKQTQPQTPPAVVPVVEKSVTPKEVVQEQEPTLDDIETPTLDDSEFVTALKAEQPQSKVSKAEIEEKLKQAEKEQEEKAVLLAQQIEADTQSTEKAIEENLSEAESAVAAENETLAAQAQARADALRAQKEAAAKAEAEARAAAKAAAAEKASKENGNGLAAQNSGPGQQGELRTLEQLRQMPGNPKPQYDAQERLQKQQGNVIFKAFVTQNGELTNFQLLQSTGHRNLDFKTLKALKQWKFYPGQQGWVELPFKWDLKGGPQEMPTLLRRRVSQQN